MSAVRRPFQYRFNYSKLSNTKSIVFYWRIIWCATRYRFVFRVIKLFNDFSNNKIQRNSPTNPPIPNICCNAQVTLWNHWICTGWVWPGEYRRVVALPNPVVETRPPLLKPQQTHTTIVSHYLPPSSLSTHSDYDISGDFMIIPRLLRLFPRSLNLLTVTLQYIHS